jgi:hypothetical protein
MSITPSHLLLSPSDNNSTINMSDFSKVGLSTVKDSSTFKKAQFHSKSPSYYLFDGSYSNNTKSNSLANMYSDMSLLTNFKDYYIDRQDNYNTILSTQLGCQSYLDKASTEKYLTYNFSINQPTKDINFHNSLLSSTKSNSKSDINYTLLNKTIIDDLSDNNVSLNKLDTEALSKTVINSASDTKHYNNPIRSITTLPLSRKNTFNLPVNNYSSLSVSSPSDEISTYKSNSNSSLKFKDLKSPNLGFLTSDKNSRLINKLHSNKGQLNLSINTSNLEDILNSTNKSSSSTNEAALYKNSSTL